MLTQRDWLKLYSFPSPWDPWTLLLFAYCLLKVLVLFFQYLLHFSLIENYYVFFIRNSILTDSFFLFILIYYLWYLIFMYKLTSLVVKRHVFIKWKRIILYELKLVSIIMLIMGRYQSKESTNDTKILEFNLRGSLVAFVVIIAVTLIIVIRFFLSILSIVNALFIKTYNILRLHLLYSYNSGQLTRFRLINPCSLFTSCAVLLYHHYVMRLESWILSGLFRPFVPNDLFIELQFNYDETLLIFRKEKRPEKYMLFGITSSRLNSLSSLKFDPNLIGPFSH